MPSRNQMEALDRQFRELQKRNDRQKAALTRLLAANTEMSAALFEIADGDLSESQCVGRAQKALDAVSAMMSSEDGSGKPEDQED